jgi:hypothetical protein
MQSDRTARADAVALLAAIVANQPTALEGAPFTPGVADAQRAGLDLDYHPNRARFDAAMRWLIDNELLERDEETEGLLIHVKGLPHYDYGRAFRITERGRALLQQRAGEAGA